MSEQVMLSERVTFIVATYRRVAALRCTLRSLQLQSHREWDAIVIGDCCGPETREMIHMFADPRIRYYNFPERYGEQSGPNSFGLHLATGAYACFLNHDDLLLADHLELAIAAMVLAQSDFHIGLAANATALRVGDNGVLEPVFTSVLPSRLSLTELITRDEYSFDPSSFWLVRTAYARQVGSWRHSSLLWRTPLRDWIMRAWRLGGVFSFGERVTGLRFWTQNLRTGVPLYTNETPEHEFMLQLMETHSPDGIREFIHLAIDKPTPKRRSFLRRIPQVFFSLDFTWLKRAVQTVFFLHWNIDHLAVTSRLVCREKGALHKNLLQKRTGESFSRATDISSLLKDPESIRVL